MTEAVRKTQVACHADVDIAAAVMQLVQQRGALASACPSEIARALSPANWRKLMPQVRDVSSKLAAQSKIEITQGGKSLPPVGPWKGPIRLRLAQKQTRD
jgi:hypothetical protein